jgi:hypothetical protein
MFDLKKLVNSMVNRGEVGTSTAQSATLLVKELPESEYAGALVEIVKSIIKINADTEIPLKERLSTLLYIDERTHTIHHRLSEDFIAGTPSVKSHLPSILAYLKELSSAYLMCLRTYHSAPVPSLLDTIRLANARGLNHQMHLILWNSLNYLKSEGAFWLQGYRLYQYAEEMGYERHAMRLYETSTRDTTCEQLLLRGAMLRLAQTDNLSPLEIVATERLIFGLSDSLHLEKQSQLEAPVFTVNLEAPEAPEPLRRGMVGKGFRYWSAQPMANQLADIMLDMDKGLPPQLSNLRLQMTQQQWNELCLKLSARWSSDGGLSLRRSERQMQNLDVNVHVGFERCAFLVKIQNLASSDSTPDQWRVYDVSSSGLGLSFYGKQVEQFTLGRTLLVKLPDSALKLGIIRRIVREKSGVTRIGIEVLGHSPIGVTLIDPAEPEADPLNGLYITQPNSNNGKRWFLLPKKLAKPGQELVFTVQGLSYRVRLKTPQQTFDDCVHSDFDTLGRVE